ncbi:hypothetical protein Tco_0749816 [Tanacetum coccineum]|uniref:Uncharacterized protein n=1 Tax=Tanacetum coccineum TaxID=301880 RepID=A0ABQ4Z2D7_9ASTR
MNYLSMLFTHMEVMRTRKARRRAQIVHSDDEDIADDSSKQGRKLSDVEVQEKASNEIELVIQDVTPIEVIHDQESSEKGQSEVSIAGATKGTASEVLVVSTADEKISTAGRTITYRRRSEEERTRKDKGKAIMTEPEPKKKSKKELEQERLSLAEAIRLQEQMDEAQKAQIARDEEIARQWEEEERQRVMSEAKSSQKIDWNDPLVIRYHALKTKPKTVAQARRNMIKYLKNQGNYKISDFKGMSYNEIRPIFEKVWDFNQHIEPMDVEHGSEKMMSPEKIEEEDVVTQKEMKEVSKESGAKRKKSLPRKSTRSKRQKMEEDVEKEELRGYLDIIPREDVPIEVESLSTKFLIVDWKTCVLTENFMYYQIFKGDGSSKNYKILSEMLEDFDRQDVEELYRLVKERYSASRPEGYNLMLWMDLHTLFEPDEEDEIWKNHHEYNLIDIHMLTEKKYPLSQEMISKMLKKRLEVDHESTQAYELLKFIRSQVMIEFQTEASKEKFKANMGIGSWFSQLEQDSNLFHIDKRVTWVDIKGIPLKLVENILESFKIITQGKVFWVRAKEVSGWIHDFVEDDKEESDTDDEIRDEELHDESEGMHTHATVEGESDVEENGEVVIMGDFNELRKQAERYGSTFNMQGADAFNSFILATGLEEPRVSRLHLDMDFPDMENNVTRKEIKKAVWDCGEDNSPSPDAFIFGFSCWYWRFWKKIWSRLL